MRRLSGPVVAILISTMCAARVIAADVSECEECAVANAIASTLQKDDRERSGLRVGGGYWIVSARFDDLDTAGLAGPARLHADNSGTYQLADRRHILSDEIQQDVELFLQQRAIESSGNPIGEYVGAAVVYRSAAAEGWRRQFGVVVGVAELAAPFQRALNRSGIGVAARESICELSYRLEVSEGFALQSDVQYIRNPGMNSTVDSSWTVGLRFELSAR